MSLLEADYKQRLAQMPPDVLPTKHFIAQLPGMGERTQVRGFEAFSRWFGKTQINGVEVVLGIASRDTETDFLLVEDRGAELWIMNETVCSNLTFYRDKAKYKPLLVAEGEFDDAVDSGYDRKFTATLNFCSEKRSFCSNCVFHGGRNKNLRYHNRGTYDTLFRGTFNSILTQPAKFPMRRVSDLASIPDSLFPEESREEGFGSVEKALEVMAQIKEGVMSAETLTREQAVEMLPDVVYELGRQFDLRRN